MSCANVFKTNFAIFAMNFIYLPIGLIFRYTEHSFYLISIFIRSTKLLFVHDSKINDEKRPTYQIKLCTLLSKSEPLLSNVEYHNKKDLGQ